MLTNKRKESSVKNRIPLTAVAFSVISIFISGCQAFHVKTPDEIKAETRIKMTEDMRARGLSEDEIKQTFTYIDMPYKKQLETAIRSSSSPAENFIRLMSKSHQSCEFKKGMVSLPSTSSFDVSNRKHEVVSCAYDSKSVVSGYFIANVKYKDKNPDKADLTDIYIKWLSYMDALSQGNSGTLSETLAADYKSASRKYEIKNNI